MYTVCVRVRVRVRDEGEKKMLQKINQFVKRIISYCIQRSNNFVLYRRYFNLRTDSRREREEGKAEIHYDFVATL